MSEEHSVFHKIDLLPQATVVSERMISFCNCSERFSHKSMDSSYCSFKGY